MQDEKTYKGTNTKKLCTHCGRTNHVIEVYYKKHGYPSSYKFYNGKQSQVNNNTTQENQHSEKEKNIIDSHDIRLTPQQYQLLEDLFKHTHIDNYQPQINHADSVFVSHCSHGNIKFVFTKMNFKILRILDYGAILIIYVFLLVFSPHIIASSQFALIFPIVILSQPIIVDVQREDWFN